MFYEYKVIAPPRRAMRFKDLEKGEHPFHRTIAETLTSMGLEGWSYVGVERLLQVRRRWLLWSREEAVEVMVFRREIRAILQGQENPMVEAPAAPARQAGAVRPMAMPHPIEAVRARRVSRPETVARVAQGARRILVRRTEIAAE
jgi:hypothetical protein